MNRSDEEIRMPLWDHLAELRKRLIFSAFALVGGFSVAYAYAEEIFNVLMRPFDQAYGAVFHKSPVMITTGMVEAFMVYLKVGMLAGAFLASPVVFHQIWKFVAPALRPRERRHAGSVVFLATLFFVGGAAFGYFGAFPLGFQYFLRITSGETIQPMIRMKEYFDLAAWMLIIFGGLFEAPLLVLYLTFLGILKTRHLVRPWRGIVIGIAVASAVCSPPDPGSMMLVMVPMMGLYGITIVLSLFLSRRDAPGAIAPPPC